MFLVLSLTSEVKEEELWCACSDIELDPFIFSAVDFSVISCYLGIFCEDLDLIFKITAPFRYVTYKN